MKDNFKKPRKHFNGNQGGDPTPVIVSNKQDKFAHIEPVLAKPLEVKVYNGNVEKALRAFRNLVQKERILSLYKEKGAYEKPSDKRRRKRNEMKRKRLEEASEVGQERRKPKKSFKPRSKSELPPQ